MKESRKSVINLRIDFGWSNFPYSSFFIYNACFILWRNKETWENLADLLLVQSNQGT